MSKKRFVVKNRRKRKVYFSILLACLLMIGFGYANLIANLGITGILGLGRYDHTLYGVLRKAAKRGVYAKKYTGSHQDSFAGTGTQDIYYWYANNDTNGTAILNKNNVVFAGHCWQMLRTTDTGGVKLIYNGEAENNQCLNTRGTHVGYDAAFLNTFTGNYYYGTSYTYNSSTGFFSLSGAVESATWNATTGRSLTKKYTCLASTSTATCSTLYLVESYQDSTRGIVIPITNTSNYSQFGVVQYILSYDSLSQIGYMYNPDTLIHLGGSTAATSGSLFGTGVSYNNGTYTLANTSSTYDSTHHYTCNSTSNTCSNVRYYYYNNFYIVLTDGRNAEEALENMLNADDINAINTTVKTAIDAWYKKYLTQYDSYIEDTIFCSDRSVRSLGGWQPNGGSTTAALLFKEYEHTTDLSCTNETDQFSTLNPKATLPYKVGFVTTPEMSLLHSSIRTTGEWYWTMTPSHYLNEIPFIEKVNSSGEIIASGANNYNTYSALGVRPVISLKPGIIYDRGNGSMASPYIIDAGSAMGPLMAENLGYDNTLTGVNCDNAQCMIDYIKSHIGN